jgi:hypothetical protein
VGTEEMTTEAGQSFEPKLVLDILILDITITINHHLERLRASSTSPRSPPYTFFTSSIHENGVKSRSLGFRRESARDSKPLVTSWMELTRLSLHFHCL